MRKNFIKILPVLFLIISGCEEKKQAQSPIPLVGAAKAIKQDVPLTVEVPAKITGSLEIQVRAQVGGILKSRLFQEGQYVQEGEKLFEIDPEPYKAALSKAFGALAQAESEVKRTERDYNRMEKLIKSGAISQKERDDSLSAYEKASANLKVAAGALKEAEINLGYTEVKAPISGIVRKEAQSIGNLVSPTGESGLLTSMVQICPLHASFSISGAVWSAINKNYRAGKLKLAQSGEIEVEVIMPDGSIYSEKGKIIFADSSEDDRTSSISLKAEIPNDKDNRVLMPGQFVRIRLVGIEYRGAIVVPSSALVSTPTGSVVYVVKEDKTVEVRPVTVELIGDKAVVDSGLKEDETVVSEGIIKVRPGQPVEVVLKSDEAKRPNANTMQDITKQQ
ncbi:MAG: efflux RND transporter periplasmic adaptor subunit [Holosporaceae bacterium]|jgi:membrane fusion protein (multidrug efflux system)|nr:efflux RND transporter periplasmic adaptor subunit [Holosporaceae bacterium]